MEATKLQLSGVTSFFSLFTSIFYTIFLSLFALTQGYQINSSIYIIIKFD